MKKILLVILIPLFYLSTSYPQLEDRFAALSESNIKGYATPLATTIGTIMNSGGFYTADVPAFFGFSISFRGMYIFIPDDQTTFTPDLIEGYSADKSPTIYGEKRTSYYGGPQGYITMPPGINKTSIPAAIPQIAGSFMGTEIMLRFLPEIDISNENTVSMFGIGVKHEISRYIPLLPVDIAVQLLYSTFEITNIVDVSNIAFNAHASKTFGLITPYFGLQYESSSVDITYDIKADPNNPLLSRDERIKVSLDGDNNFRMTIGAALSLGFFILNADYNIASQSLFSGGLTFAF